AAIGRRRSLRPGRAGHGPCARAGRHRPGGDGGRPQTANARPCSTSVRRRRRARHGEESTGRTGDPGRQRSVGLGSAAPAAAGRVKGRVTMAFLIPDNLKSRKDVSDAIRRVARAFAIALDEDVTVWYEPLFDPDGELPHLVVLDPRLGIVVLEVLKGRDKAKLLGAVRGRLRIEIDGEEREVDNPLERAERFADALRTRLRAHPSLA